MVAVPSGAVVAAKDAASAARALGLAPEEVRAVLQGGTATAGATPTATAPGAADTRVASGAAAPAMDEKCKALLEQVRRLVRGPAHHRVEAHGEQQETDQDATQQHGSGAILRAQELLVTVVAFPLPPARLLPFPPEPPT